MYVPVPYRYVRSNLYCTSVHLSSPMSGFFSVPTKRHCQICLVERDDDDDDDELAGWVIFTWRCIFGLSTLIHSSNLFSNKMNSSSIAGE